MYYFSKIISIVYIDTHPDAIHVELSGIVWGIAH